MKICPSRIKSAKHTQPIFAKYSFKAYIYCVLTIIPILLLPVNAFTQSITRPCNSQENKSFSLKYHESFTKQDSPLFVYFPGGPGSSVNDIWPIPKDENYLYFDPRGTGENIACGENLELSTVKLAQDAVAIIKSKKFKTIYLYGVSYETAVATVTAHILEGLDLEVILILEGVVSRALNRDEFIAQYASRWKKVLQQINSLEKFDSLGFDKNVWGAWIEQTLTMRLIPQTEQEMAKLINSRTEELKQQLTEIQNGGTLTEQQKLVFRKIGCHELVDYSSVTDNNFILDGKTLEHAVGNLCENDKLDRPFDAKKWGLKKTKIYYFIGDSDPITPFANYHIDSNPKAKKLIYDFALAGHNPLGVNSADCAENVIKAISENSSDIFKTCLTKPSLRKFAN